MKMNKVLLATAVVASISSCALASVQMLDTIMYLMEIMVL